MHKRQLTHLFLNQLLFTPSSVPLAVPLSVPLAADCPLSPARPCSVAAQTAGPGRSRGVVLPSTPHEPTVPSRGRCWGSPSSRGLRGAPGMGSLQGAGFGPTWMQDPAAPAPRKVPEEPVADWVSRSVW